MGLVPSNPQIMDLNAPHPLPLGHIVDIGMGLVVPLDSTLPILHRDVTSKPLLCYRELYYIPESIHMRVSLPGECVDNPPEGEVALYLFMFGYGVYLYTLCFNIFCYMLTLPHPICSQRMEYPY